MFAHILYIKKEKLAIDSMYEKKCVSLQIN